MAGDSVKYTIRYGYEAPKTWSEGYDKTQTLFNKYEDNVVSVTLPANLTVMRSAETASDFVAVPNADGTTTYQFRLADADPAAADLSFQILVYVGGNGTANAINTYTLDDAVEFSTSFTVLNKAERDDDGNYVQVATYTQTQVADAGAVTTDSPDQWGVKKTALTADVVRGTDGQDGTATVTYKVEVGLLADDGESVLTDPSSYRRNGRDAMESVKLTETMKAIFDYSGSYPAGTEAYFAKGATIAKIGADGKPGEATEFWSQQGSTAEIELIDEAWDNGKKLALNTEKVDSNGDGTRDTDVPAYTTYLVTATYVVPEAAVLDFYSEIQGKINSENKVKLDTKLAKKDAAQDESEDSIVALIPLKDPASFKVIKKLGSKAYNNKYGALYFKLYTTDGSDFMVYTKNEAAGTYEAAATEMAKEFTVPENTQYYLVAGKSYAVEEIMTADQQTKMDYEADKSSNLTSTPAEKEDWVATVVNSEKFGVIDITKTDDSGKKLKNVGFTLYNSEGVAVGTEQKTDADGVASFENVAFGTYTVVETTPLTGYVGGYSQEVTVSKANKSIQLTATNKKNMANISLTKYVGIAGDYSKATASFNGTFDLYRKIEGGTAEKVTKDVYGEDIATTIEASSGDQQGKITATVPVYDANGKLYAYYFVENIPDGWYDPANPSATTATSTEVTLADENGKAKSDITNVDLYNRARIDITVTKEFYGLSGKNMVKQTGKTVDVRLYKKVDGTLTQVGVAQTVGSAVAKWEDLMILNADGSKIEYYVNEDDIAGYKLDAASGTQETIDGKTYIKLDITDAKVSNYVFNQNLYNVEQAVPVIVYKKNYYTKAFVSGAKVTIYTDSACTTIAKDFRTGAELKDVEISDANGMGAALEVGKTYYVVETVNNTGLKQVNATTAAPLTLNTTVTLAYNKGITVPTATVYNQPNPRVLITKYKQDGKTKLSGAVFTLYKKNDAGKYESVATVKGNNTVEVIRVEPGVYYIAETTVPDGYINPNTNPDMYTGLVQGTTTDGKTLSFKEVTIADASTSATKTDDNQVTFTWTNKNNLGNLTVTKTIDGATANVAGFKVQIKNGDTVVKEGTTGTNGKVTFNNLPVYDATGAKIQYTVVEADLTAEQAKTYYKISDGQTVTLTANATTTKDVDGNNVVVANGTLTTIEAQKMYRHTWEYQYTNTQYPMSGVTTALFALDTTSNTWKKVEGSEQVTGSTGKISYDGLRRDTAYAIVELSCTDEDMHPINATSGAELQFAGAITEIAAADLGNYNVLSINAETAEAKRESVTNLGKMINADHWVQLDITKYVRHLQKGDPTPTAVDTATDSRYNGAVYTLYRYVMPEGQTAVDFNPANPTAAGTWEAMGTYSSGSFFDLEGKQVNGKFRSDVDMHADKDVVYLLMENNAGPSGATMLSNFRYTFWSCQGESYTVNMTDGSTVRTQQYTIDAVNYDDLLNVTYDGEGDKILLGKVRIAKWQDTIDPATGLPQANYSPLPNATFGLYVPTNEGDVLVEELTVGLDNDEEEAAGEEKAWAQSSLYQLQIHGDNPTTGTLINYTYKDGKGFSTQVEIAELASGTDSKGSYKVYGTPVYIQELDAPEGFTYGSQKMNMYLCFVTYAAADKSAGTVINDAYFVTAAVSQDPLAQNQLGTAASVKWDNSSYSNGQYRIVDYPEQDTLVTIHKYGYTPTQDTITAANSEELDAMSIETRAALSGVKMSLEKLVNGKWENWDYINKKVSSAQQTFTTRSDGSFLFGLGLEQGTYRVKEVDLDAWATEYENAYADDAHARIFTVTGDAAVSVSMYNPTKVDLKVQKTDVNGNAVEATFKLGTTEKTGTEVTFENISSGTYKLSETSSTTSNAYLQKYAASTGNQELINLVGKGTLVGYSYTVPQVKDGDTVTSQDSVVTTIGFNGADIQLQIKNPTKVSLGITKVTELDTSKTLAGAKFSVKYTAFTGFEGETAVTASTAWTDKGTMTTDANGKISLTGQDPGIYSFTETEAPAGYDIIKDKSGNAITYYVVVTGGLNVTVSGLPESATIAKADGSEYTVGTKYTDATAEMVKVPNREKTTASASKTVTSGKVDGTTLTWSVRLDLYTAATGGTLVGSATLTNENASDIKFQLNGKDAQLSQGATYYVEETVVSTPATDYAVTEVLINGAKVSATGSRYAFTVTNSNPVAIAVTNQYLRGTVTFKKCDSDDQTKLLTGAEFKVTDANGADIAGATVTESLETPGIYTANIPLTSAAETNYVIVETKAPVNYVFDETAKLEVVLSAENNVVDAQVGSNIKNVLGYHLDVTKYNNRHDAAEPYAPAAAAEGDATFTLYRYRNNKWSVVSVDSIGEDGMVHWLMAPGGTYAFAETDFNESKFDYLDSVYSKGQNVTDNMTTITVQGNEIQVYLISNVRDSYEYSYYNMPKTQVTIVKRDAGGYPLGVTPVADFAIYEIDQALPADKAAAEQVIAGLTADQRVYKGVTKLVEADGTAQTSYTYKKLDPTKNYVVVETEVSSYDEAMDYNTLNKDDKRVVWYASVPASDEPARTVYLDNVFSTAGTTISKAAVDSDTISESDVYLNNQLEAHVGTLLTDSRTVAFTINPVVTGRNQALKSVVVTDQGITFAGATTTYAIKGITVGAATQNVENFLTTVDDATVYAKLTWKDASGNAISDLTLRLDENKTVSEKLIPSAATNFSIEYYSDAVSNATNGAYGLGADFECGQITVIAKVDQQADGTPENPVEPITSLTNKANIAIAYPQWKADGSGTEDKTATAKDDATVIVDPITYPQVDVEKASNPSDAVEMGKNVTYTITVKNLSTSTVDFVDPEVLDMLPTGVTFAGGYSVGTGTQGETFDIKLSRYTGKPTFSYDSGDGDGTILYGDAETAVAFQLTGSLKPGSSVDVTFTAKVSQSAIMYGQNIENYVFLSSNYTSIHTTDNPQGYSFKNKYNVFPDTLKKAAENLKKEALVREGGLDDKLGNLLDDQFAWVSSLVSTKLVGSTSLTLVKSIQGDQDAGYSSDDDFLATSTRTNSTPGSETEGWVKYRLMVYNGNDYKQRWISVGDTMPAVTDGRGSYWDVIMKKVTGATVGASAVKQGEGFDLYYYTGSRQDAAANLTTWLKESADYGNSKAWNQANVQLPTGWHKAADVAEADMPTVTAFIVLFKGGIELNPGERIVITYDTDVKDYPKDSEFDEIAFENTNNTFYTSTANAYKPLLSNTVSVTLMDGNVDVQGDLWIDEDWDATQESQNRRDYSQYKIIQKLVDNFEFGIEDNRTSAYTAHDDEGGQNTATGESIKHFTFSDLGAALQVRDPLYKDRLLNVGALKTTDPYNYYLTASITDKSLLDIFSITTLGDEAYMSDDADSIPSAHQLDDNFYTTAANGDNGEYKTDPFFLQYTENSDQSKDVGLTMERDLEITKVCDDDQTIVLEGAEFQIYGPYNEGEAATKGIAGGTLAKFTQAEDGSYAYDPANGTVTTLVTNAEGTIKVTGLNWWKEYIVTETKAAEGYELTGASAESTSDAEGYVTEVSALEGVDAAWVLELPNTDKMAKTDAITVSDVRKGTADVVVYKALTTQKGVTDVTLKAGDFTFKMEAVDNAPMPEAATEGAIQLSNDADGKVDFGEITYVKPGTYKYKMTEVIPATKKPGFTYSTDTIYAQVVVAWSDTEQKLVSTVTYTDAQGNALVDDEGNAVRPTFINDYTPEDATASVPVQKLITGNTPPTDKTFTFKLTAQENAPMPEGAVEGAKTVTVTGTGTGNFGDITFNKVGEYTYKVVEVAGTDDGYTYDDSEYDVVVTVVNNEATGKLVASWVAKKDGEVVADITTIPFTNPYDPEDTNINLPVVKMMSGSQVFTTKTYSFTLTANSMQAPDMPEGASVPMPAGSVDGVKTVSILGAGSTNFGQIDYTCAGTYVYKVKEVIPDPKDKGYTYDESTHTYVVTVVDNDGHLSATWKMDDTANAATFTNDYTPEATTAQLPVKKVITGNPTFDDKVFTFTLTAQDNAPMPTDAVSGVKTVTVVGAGETVFGIITYDKVGTYKYTVAETSGTDHGYTYSTEIYEATVVVTDNDGELINSVSYKKNDAAAESPVFTNNYTPDPTTQVLPVEKKLTGNPTFDDKTFKFELEAVSMDAPGIAEGSAVPMPAGTTGTKATVTTTGAQKVSYNAIEYKYAGVYKYTIKELEGTDNGYTYDGTVYDVTVTVVDCAEGKLSATYTMVARTDGEQQAASVQTAEFTNNYTPDPTYQVLPAEKFLTGNPTPTDKTFQFQLKAVSMDAPGIPEGSVVPMPEDAVDGVSTIEAVGAQKVDFASIKYTYAGTYNYTIEELEGTDHGYTYDGNVYDVTVTVVDCAEGKLSATYEMTIRAAADDEADGDDGDNGEGDDADGDNAADKADFTNNYNPDDTTLVLPVEKKLTGNPTPSDKQFKFELKAVEMDAPGITYDNVPMPEGEGNITYTMGAAKAEFGEILYDYAGTYKYTIEELEGTDHGYTYDGTIYDVTVVVTDTEGVLSAVYTMVARADEPEAEDPETDDPESDDPESEPVEGQDTDSTNDDVDGDDVDGDDADGDDAEGDDADGDDADGDDPEGDDPEEADDQIAVFTNNYNPDDTELVLPVEKKLTGNDTPTDKTFQFQLKAVSMDAPGITYENVPMPAEGADLVTIVGAGTAEFGAIPYDYAGVYKYTIEELAGTDYGYTYDGTVYDVTVTVVDNDGVLAADYTMIVRTDIPEADDDADGDEGELIEGQDPEATNDDVDGDDPEADEAEGDDAQPEFVKIATFTNNYNPDDTTLVVPVKKVLEGNETPSDKRFDFELVGFDGAPMPEGDGNVTFTMGAGEAEFGEILYDAAGTYTYTIKEIEGTEHAYTYSTDVYDVTVVVTDTEGVLSAEYTLAKAGEAAEAAEFVNTYIPDTVDVVLPIEKVLEGNATPEDKEFTFTLSAVDNAPMPAEGGETATVIGAGTADFGAITYNTVGQYDYTVAEVTGTDHGYTYSTDVYDVTVIVTDNDGVLEATWSYAKDGQDAESMTFVNTYVPDATEISIPVKKVLTGVATPEDEDFDFVLAAKDNAPMPAEGEETVTITGAGEGSFGTIAYTAAGTYEYTVSEVDGKIAGYFYDTTVFDVTVTVTDNDGVLSAAYALSVEGEAADEVCFVNDYQNGNAKAAFEAVKILENKTLEDDMFKFTLTDEDGKVLQTVGNKANGKIAFDAIVYDQPGTYQYTIAEVKGDMAGVTYATNTVKVVVTVTDEGGQLVAAVDYESEATFKNVYTPDNPPTPPTPPKTGDSTGQGLLLSSLLAVVSGGLVLLAGRKRRREDC